MAYGSLVTHGEALVTSLVACPSIRVIYRPHPRTGTQSHADAQADAHIRQILARAPGRHLVDTGAYGWQWAFADACVTDISSVAYDWLATGKPLMITRPEHEGAYLPASRLLEAAPLLSADDASSAADRILDLLSQPREEWADLVRYYFGDTTPGASTARFHAALDEALASARPAVSTRKHGF
jgi:CDP-glycerol glycerophosphotransferase (TagB/SpsB family)